MVLSVIKGQATELLSVKSIESNALDSYNSRSCTYIIWCNISRVPPIRIDCRFLIASSSLSRPGVCVY